MPDTMPPATVTYAAAPKTELPGTPVPKQEDMEPPAINRRLPRGKKLPGYGVEYFNQLVAQYLTLPLLDKNERNAKAIAVANAIIHEQHKSKQRRQPLNWGDVSGLEMAVLQLMPEAYLQRYAWNLRARYQEVAGQCWNDFYQQSQPPGEPTPTKNAPKDALPATVSVTNAAPGTLTRFTLMTPAASDQGAAANEAHADSDSTAKLRADLCVLLGDLQRLRSTIQAREEKRSAIAVWSSLLVLLSLLCALAVYAVPRIYADRAAKTAVTSAAIPPKVAAHKTLTTYSARSTANPAAPVKPASSASTPLPAAKLPLSSPFELLQMAVLVILCGTMGGLISMMRRLQTLPSGSTPLLDTIALNAGQFGIGMSPVYGAIFAIVLYVIFLSGLLNSVIAPAAQTAVFPMFRDATPATTPDYAKLLVWAFIAGFAEKLVPDVLDRLTVKNTAAAQAKSQGSGVG